MMVGHSPIHAVYPHFYWVGYFAISEQGKILDGVVLFPPWPGRDVRRGSSTITFLEL